MKKILITGGAGFIGSHIADTLLDHGFEVVILDDLSSGNPKNIPQQARFYQADICDQGALEEIFQAENPEIICHHAAQINVRTSLQDPQKDAQINILGGLNLLQKCQKYGVKKVIFASTGGAIYGETPNIPTPETEYSRPESPYGIAKFSFENYLHFFEKHFGISATILRYANVYGPRQNAKGEAGVVALFCNQMLHGEIPAINGDGEQTRDFVFVTDVARANLLAVQNPEISGVFNVGTGIETNVNAVFSEMGQCLGVSVSPKRNPTISGEIGRSCLDFEKIKNTFGWSPKVNFTDGIAKTVEYFQKEK